MPSGLRSIEVIEDPLRVLRLAVGREAHHLVLAGVHLESGVVGERRVEQAERMRESGSRAAPRACCPCPNASDVVAHSPTPSIVSTAASSNGDGKNALAAWLRWCSEKSRRPSRSRSLAALPQLVGEQVPEEQLLPQPHRDRHAEGLEALGREREVGLEQPLELQERLVVEGDVVDLVERASALRAGNSPPRAQESARRASCA